MKTYEGAVRDGDQTCLPPLKVCGVPTISYGLSCLLQFCTTLTRLRNSDKSVCCLLDLKQFLGWFHSIGGVLSVAKDNKNNFNFYVSSHFLKEFSTTWKNVLNIDMCTTVLGTIPNLSKRKRLRWKEMLLMTKLWL